MTGAGGCSGCNDQIRHLQRPASSIPAFRKAGVGFTNQCLKQICSTGLFCQVGRTLTVQPLQVDGIRYFDDSPRKGHREGPGYIGGGSLPDSGHRPGHGPPECPLPDEPQAYREPGVDGKIDSSSIPLGPKHAPPPDEKLRTAAKASSSVHREACWQSHGHTWVPVESLDQRLEVAVRHQDVILGKPAEELGQGFLQQKVAVSDPIEVVGSLHHLDDRIPSEQVLEPCG